MSIHNISALPSAHSSPKATATSVTEPPRIKPEKMPLFEALKTDSHIQAEVDVFMNTKMFQELMD